MPNVHAEQHDRRPIAVRALWRVELRSLRLNQLEAALDGQVGSSPLFLLTLLYVVVNMAVTRNKHHGRG